ncbi:MAG TPA: head GIN domain-containing protein [Gaiellaceae bacterium]|nr:head GIN domain-containing protein [Gaiellaceae bacterium]
MLVVVLVAVGWLLLVRYDAVQGSSRSDRPRGSGVAATQARSLASFSGVELAGSNIVTIHAGSKQSVVVHADDNLLRRVTTEVRGGSLVIGNSGSFDTESPMSVEVTVPSLDTLTLSGSGTLTADAVQAEQLTVTLSGSGVVRASGSVTRLDVSLDGSGDVQLEDLVARDAKAALNASGRILVNATNTLEASVHGSGVIVYEGSPGHVTTSVTGSGVVTHG